MPRRDVEEEGGEKGTGETGKQPRKRRPRQNHEEAKAVYCSSLSYTFHIALSNA